MTLRKPLFFNSQEGINQEFDATSDTAQFAQLTLTGIGGVGINANGQLVSNVASPQAAMDAATKGYVDSVAQGLNVKQAVLAMNATNLTSLSGTQTIDGYAAQIGDRILLTAQTNAIQNGIWVVQSGTWVRPADFAAGSHAATSFCFVEQGNTYADNGFTVSTDAPNDVVDTNTLAWTQFTGAGEVIAGSGLTKSGNTLAVLLASSCGLQFTSGALDTYLNGTGGLTKNSSGLAVLLQNAGTGTATIASTATGLGVLGVPSLFTVAGSATTANVSATNLNTLTMGATTTADALHTHGNVISAKVTGETHTTGTALSAGDPVGWGPAGSTLVRGDAGADAQARIIGVALNTTAANASSIIIKRGIAKGVLSGATPGAAYYLAVGGGLTATIPSGSLLRLVRIGWAVNSTDLDVVLHDLGKRSS